MKAQTNIKRLPDVRGNKPHTIRGKSNHSFSTSLYKKREVNRQDRPVHFYEWQLPDSRTDLTGTKGEGYLYVADWQIIDQD
jgi:hypothetical protein